MFTEGVICSSIYCCKEMCAIMTPGTDGFGKRIGGVRQMGKILEDNIDNSIGGHVDGIYGSTTSKPD